MQERRLFLDGLRGCSSVVVMLFHIVGVTACCPWNVHWNVFLDGSFAVSLFFCVSGFSLACIPPERVAHAAVARWPRLSLPVLAYVVLGWLIVPYPGPRTVKGFARALVDNVFNRFFFSMKERPNEEWSYFGQLWTMRNEMLGSLVVFLHTLTREHLDQARLAPAAALLIFAINPQLACFAVGVFWRYHFCRLTDAELPVRLDTCLQMSALFVVTTLYYATRPFHQYDWLTDWPLVFEYVLGIIQATRACALFVFLARCGEARAVLESRTPLFLGAISYPLYLVHMIVNYAPNRVFQNLPSYAAWGRPVKVLLSLLLAAGTRGVDRRSVLAARSLSQYFSARTPVAGV
jgi:peptidoglycan/LPS O-acetylase OafA/YrhL